MPEKIVLPGNLTGRERDRYFKCDKRSTMPEHSDGEEYEVFLTRAVEHVDFVEIGAEEMTL